MAPIVKTAPAAAHTPLGVCPPALTGARPLANQPNPRLRHIFAIEALARGPNDHSTARVLASIGADNCYRFDQAARGHGFAQKHSAHRVTDRNGHGAQETGQKPE